MARAYEQVAVDALHGFVSANLPAQLASIDSTLRLPVDYVKAATLADNRSPLVQIYDRTTEPYEEAGHRTSMAIVDCDLVITFNGTTDIEANEAIMRKYCQAIRAVLMSDVTLDGAVVESVWTEVVRDFPIDYKSQTRAVRAFGVKVLVHDPA